jgi:hypothetical protein
MGKNHRTPQYAIFYSQPPVTSSLLHPNIFFNTLFSNTLSLYYFLPSNWDIVCIISANLGNDHCKANVYKAENVFVGGLSLSKHPFYELGKFKLKKKEKVGFLCEMLTLKWNARADAQIMNSQIHAETMRRIAK